MDLKVGALFAISGAVAGYSELGSGAVQGWSEGGEVPGTSGLGLRSIDGPTSDPVVTESGTSRDE